MNKFIVNFYLDGALMMSEVDGFDVIGVSRKITKQFHIPTCAVVSVIKMGVAR